MKPHVFFHVRTVAGVATAYVDWARYRLIKVWWAWDETTPTDLWLECEPIE